MLTSLSISWGITIAICLGVCYYHSKERNKDKEQTCIPVQQNVSTQSFTPPSEIISQKNKIVPFYVDISESSQRYPLVEYMSAYQKKEISSDEKYEVLVRDAIEGLASSLIEAKAVQVEEKQIDGETVHRCSLQVLLPEEKQ